MDKIYELSRDGKPYLVVGAKNIRDLYEKKDLYTKENIGIKVRELSVKEFNKEYGWIAKPIKEN